MRHKGLRKETMGKELYVPINIEALVVGKGGLQVADMESVFWELDKKPLGEITEVSPFQTRKLQPGVHLHWAMPDSLLQGEKDDEEILFKPLPNRWIITRLRSVNDEIERTSWILFSDEIHRLNFEEEYGNASITIPVYIQKDGFFKSAGPKGKSYGYLGRCIPYEEYEEEAEEMKLKPLTGVGWGEPEFAAAYQKGASGFGFWDQVEWKEADTLTYVVCGYYKDPEEDPLRGGADSLDKLAWKIQDSEIQEVPEHTVCHGTIRGVQWPGKEAVIDGGVPEGEVEVAIGNNSPEALAALLRRKNPGDRAMERLLVYQQQDSLKKLKGNEIDAIIEIEEEAHRHQFADSGAGYHFELERKGDEAEYVPLTDVSYRLLEQLNDHQRELEKLEKERLADAQNLYVYWYLYVVLYNQKDDERWKIYGEEARQKAMVSCIDRIKDMVGRCRKLEADYNITQDDLMKDRFLIGAQVAQKQMRLVKKENPRAYEPVPPVILVHGEGVQRTFRQGYQQDTDGMLPCRLTLISEREVVWDEKKKVVRAEEILKLMGGRQEHFPEFCGLLAAEAVLFDRSLLSTALHMTLSGAVIREVAGGGEEAPFSIAMSDWKQPWNPLELMWEVILTPIGDEDGAGNTLRHFNLGEIDLEWDKKTEGMGKEYLIAGTTLLTPHAAENMKDKTARLMTMTKRRAREGRQLLDAIGTQDTLSQQLEGFHDACLRARDRIHIPIYWKEWDETETELSLEELQACMDNGVLAPTLFDMGAYLPIRSGMGRILRLWIVDSYGQIKYVQDSIKGVEAKVFISESLKLEGVQKCFLLPPRFLQPCAVTTRWLAARTGLTEAVDACTTPVCGFIRPDLLNKSIYLYDNQGNSIGSVEAVRGGSHLTPPPGISSDTTWKINETLYRFMRWLTTERALTELLEYLTGYFDHVLAEGTSQFYELCFGKILALAQAEINVEPQSDYRRYLKDDGDLSHMDYVTDGYENTEFLVRMGDSRRAADGLAGFFPGEIEDSEKGQGYFHGVDLDIVKAEWQKVRPCDCWEHTLSRPARKITMLFDPLCRITITTGLLPAASMKLEPLWYEDYMNKMKTIFPVWPVLFPEGQVELPIPEMENGKWIWTEKCLTAGWQETKAEEVSENLFNGRGIISEGYIKEEKE